MALGAIKTQLAELQASVESRDLAALAATRLQAGNVWQGLSPVLDAYVKSLGGDVSGNSSVAGGGGGGLHRGGGGCWREFGWGFGGWTGWEVVGWRNGR